MTTENELLAELAAALYRPPLDPRIHVTAPMLSKASGICFKVAKEHLDRMVESGKLRKFEAQDPGGNIVTAYVRADG